MRVKGRDLRLVLLSIQMYPDVKRGGAVFAKNFQRMLRGLVYEFVTITLRHEKVTDADSVWVKVPWRITSKIRFLIALPVYIVFTMRMLSRTRPDFVISNTVYESLPPLLTGRPFVLVMHDTSPFDVGLISKPIALLAIRKAEAIVCPSAATARKIGHFCNKKIFILSNYICREKFERIANARADLLNEKYPKLQGKKIVLFIGPISKHKGIYCLLEAMREVRKEYPDAFLVVVGPGSERERRREDKGVMYAGILSDEEIASSLAAADVFALPSTGREGFGIVLLEAMAAGKPIIAGNLDAFKEVAEGCAIFVDGNDSNSIAEAIKTILSDERLALQLSRGARERTKKFLESNVRYQYKKLLSELKEHSQINKRKN